MCWRKVVWFDMENGGVRESACEREWGWGD